MPLWLIWQEKMNKVWLWYMFKMECAYDKPESKFGEQGWKKCEGFRGIKK